LEQPYFYPECFLLCDWTGNRGHSSSYALVRTAVLYPFVGHGHGKRAEWNFLGLDRFVEDLVSQRHQIEMLLSLGLLLGSGTLFGAGRYGRDAAHD